MAPRLDVRRFRRERPPVVLLGSLNLVRSLGLARIPTILATSDRAEPALLSRYCDTRLPLPPLEQREAVLDVLLSAGERLREALGKPVPLYYGNDDTLNLVQECRAELASCYRLVLNDPGVARALLDKDAFNAIARERALPVPRMLRWEELDCFTEPVLVKPKTRLAWDASPVHLRLFDGKGKARVFPNGWTLKADPLAAQLREELALQEYIAGDDRQLWSFHGFATERAELLAWFIGRKLRTYPASTGMSSYLELARDAELAALGRDIVARVPVKGVFKMDLKRDPRTGRFHLLEINARFNLWHYLAARNGLNLPAIAYDYMVEGKRPSHTSYRTSHRWLSLRFDSRAYWELRSRGELGFGAWLWSLLSARKVCDVFSWRDPLPYLCHVAGYGRRARRLLGRFRVQFRQWLSTAF
jgi:D-aspartate ligase